MSSETENLGLPTIVFSKIDQNWDSVRSQVLKAVEEYGCFVAWYDKISLELQCAFLSELEELFDLPLETKMRYLSEKPYQGYMASSPYSPFETMTINDPFNFDEVERMRNALWPQEKSTFSKTIESFSKQVSELGKIIRTMILESLGVEKYSEEHMCYVEDILRMTKYGSPKTNEMQPSLPAHTDNNIITILCQNKVDGLEVQTKAGEWIKAKFSPHSFIIFFGESFRAWTNGRVHLACHRVRISGNEDRISAGLFSTFKAGHMVKAPEELVDEEHPLLYKPFDFSEFIKFFVACDRKNLLFSLKDYCGI